MFNCIEYFLDVEFFYKFFLPGRMLLLGCHVTRPQLNTVVARVLQMREQLPSAGTWFHVGRRLVVVGDGPRRVEEDHPPVLLALLSQVEEVGVGFLDGVRGLQRLHVLLYVLLAPTRRERPPDYVRIRVQRLRVTSASSCRNKSSCRPRGRPVMMIERAKQVELVLFKLLFHAAAVLHALELRAPARAIAGRKHHNTRFSFLGGDASFLGLGRFLA